MNGCEYCLSARTFLGANVAKVGAAELDRARDGDSGNTRVRAVLRLATAVVRGRRVGDDLISDVRAAGVTGEEIAETVGHAALNVLTNLFNNLAATDNDWPTVQPRTRAA